MQSNLREYSSSSFSNVPKLLQPFSSPRADVLLTSHSAIRPSANLLETLCPARVRAALSHWPARRLERCETDCETDTMSPMLVSSQRASYAPMWWFGMQEVYSRITCADEHFIPRHPESAARLCVSVFVMQEGTCDRRLQRRRGSQQDHDYGQ